MSEARFHPCKTVVDGRTKETAQKPSLGRVTSGKPLRVWLFYWIPAFETVQKTSLGYAGGKPNPLNPPYQGDFPLNSPLIRGARGVKNDERWVSCTVSFAGMTNIGFLHSLFRRNDKYWFFAQSLSQE